ncbi:hypothetical protein [Oceanithermus sp.]|uniref:hypothetical protein n=1 Tax=Oceanithermus sp. TaxID=2268145 RepID=UPI0025DD01FC|nr:hypothetical protein [Oceanithermus sp.]
MRTLLVLAAIVGGVYLYGVNYGLALGLPPFTPVYYLNYSGERAYGVRVTGASDAVKIKVDGELKKGRVSVWVTHRGRRVGKVKTYKGTFRDEVKVKVEPGSYTVHLKILDAEGRVRYDWVSTKFKPF